MPQVIVTRGAQITLAKEVRDKLDIREGDIVTVNAIGEMAIITKRDAGAWRRAGDFLPDDFEATLRALREDSGKRLKRLGFA